MSAPIQPEHVRPMRIVRVLIGLAVAATSIAIASGTALVLLDPADGSTAEAVIALTAVTSGLSVAGLTIAATVYAQFAGLWRYAPAWLRGATWLVAAIATATTLWSLGT